DVTDLAFLLDTTVAEPVFDMLPPSDTPPPGDHETASPTADLGGQTEAGAVVVLEGTAFHTTADARGRFTFAAVPLAQGLNTLAARAIDVAGNENISRRTFQRLLDCNFTTDLAGWTTGQSGGSPSGAGTVSAVGGAATLREGDSFTVSLQRTFM